MSDAEYVMPNPIECKDCGAEQKVEIVVATHTCPNCGGADFKIERKPGVPAICDFCSSPEVAHAYPCRDFSQQITVPNAPGWGSVGWWAACGPCYRLIERGDRQALSMRSAKRQKRHNPSTEGVPLKLLYEQIRQLHDNFWANRQGPPLEHLEGS